MLLCTVIILIYVISGTIRSVWRFLCLLWRSLSGMAPACCDSLPEEGPRQDNSMCSSNNGQVTLKRLAWPLRLCPMYYVCVTCFDSKKPMACSCSGRLQQRPAAPACLALSGALRSLGGRRIPCTPGSAEFYVLCLLFTVVAYVSQDTYVTRIFYLCTRLFFLPCMSFAIIAAEAAAGQACFVKVVVIKSNLSPKKKLKAAS